jgi:hypothetical protein
MREHEFRVVPRTRTGIPLYTWSVGARRDKADGALSGLTTHLVLPYQVVFLLAYIFTRDR